MFFHSIIQSPSFSINTKYIDTIFTSVHKHIGKYQKGTINIVFVSPKDIQELNNKYREKNIVTDVLSFHYFDDFSLVTDDEDIAGEMIFCEEKIIEQGKEFGLGSEKEFYKLLIHSLLHILGYDHEDENDYEEMQEVENMLWKDVFGENIC